MPEPTAQLPRNCFVICSTDGQWWTGRGWSDRAERALPFATPRRAYLDAQAAWLRLRRRRPCVILYLPSATTLYHKAPSPPTSAAVKTCNVHFDSYAGRFTVRAELLGTCRRAGKNHYKVRLLEPAMRRRAGQVLYPPKHAVTDITEG
jgi:hypothetical protein